MQGDCPAFGHYRCIIAHDGCAFPVVAGRLHPVLKTREGVLISSEFNQHQKRTSLQTCAPPAPSGSAGEYRAVIPLGSSRTTTWALCHEEGMQRPEAEVLFGF